MCNLFPVSENLTNRSDSNNWEAVGRSDDLKDCGFADFLSPICYLSYEMAYTHRGAKTVMIFCQLKRTGLTSQGDEHEQG